MSNTQESDLMTLRLRLSVWIARLENAVRAVENELEIQRGDHD